MFKEYRKRAKLTQEELSENIKIDYTTYQRIESNITIPQTNTFAKLVFALNLSNEEIIDLLKYYATIKNKKGKKEIQ